MFTSLAFQYAKKILYYIFPRAAIIFPLSNGSRRRMRHANISCLFSGAKDIRAERHPFFHPCPNADFRKSRHLL